MDECSDNLLQLQIVSYRIHTVQQWQKKFGKCASSLIFAKVFLYHVCKFYTICNQFGLDRIPECELTLTNFLVIIYACTDVCIIKYVHDCYIYVLTYLVSYIMHFCRVLDCIWSSHKWLFLDIVHLSFGSKNILSIEIS